MCIHWEYVWCQCQILVLAPTYPTLHKYAHSTSGTLCVSAGNVRGASAKYWYQHQHIQHYTNTPTALQKLHVCLLGMCVVLVPNIGISTSISNSTRIRPQLLRNLMCVHWECAWCQCQISVLAPAYPTLHKYPHSTSETSCVSAGNVHRGQVYGQGQDQCKGYPKVTFCKILVLTPPYLKLHRYARNTSEISCEGMRVVLVPNISISTSISNTTQIRPQHFRNFMCVHWECAWCQCQILVLVPAYQTLHKYVHRTSGTSCVSTGNMCGASAKYWYQHQHIQHYTNTPTALQELYVCLLGMCVVLVPNIGFNSSISNTTQIRPQHFRKVMCVHWEYVWCQCQISVLAPAYPTLHKYAHSTSGTSRVSTGNVRGASAKYWYQHQHIQHFTNALTPLQELNVCPLGMCVVLVPNIGFSYSISNTTQIRPQHFRKVMCVHWEYVWCQCQISVLAPAYPTLHKYAHSTSGTSRVSSGNVRGASAKYWHQHQHIQHFTNALTALKELNVCPLGMCVVLVPNIGFSSSISNTTQIRPQHFRKVMCVHWECAWCQCQISVLAPAYPTLHKYAHSTSGTSGVSTGNVRGASAKYRYQHQHIQHYTNIPTAHQKLHVCLLGMFIGVRSTAIQGQDQCKGYPKVTFCKILVLTPPYLKLHRYARNTSEISCEGMRVVLVPNISISTSISNTTQIRPQHFRNFMCVHWECAWCQCQILVLVPAHQTLHKYVHRTSGTSCVSTGNMCGASAKYWYQHQHIQHYTNTPTALQELYVCLLGMCVVLVPNIGFSSSISNTTQIRPQHFRKVMCVHWEYVWCQCQISVLAPAYPTLHKYAHSTSGTSRVSTGNVRGASAKFWHKHQHIQHFTNALTALQELNVCPLGMCVVLVPNIGFSSSISNTTQIRPQHFRKVMCVHWECAWCQCQISVLAPAYPTLHKYPHSTSETSCVSAGNVHRGQVYGQGQDQCKGYPKVTFCKILVLTPPYIKLHRYARNTSEISCEGMRVVLVPNISISTSISNTTQIRPQHFRNFMCVHWECAWCQCQILVLVPAYQTLHKYVHRTSRTSCVSTGNMCGASAKYWYQHQHIQHYTNTPTALQELYVCLLGMCVVLVPNIGISTSISNTTQIRPQHFRNFTCVHWECAWCQCQILVLAPAYTTLHKYAHTTSGT